MDTLLISNSLIISSLLALPLAVFLLLFFLNNKISPLAAWLGVAAQAFCLLASIYIFTQIQTSQQLYEEFTWFELAQNVKINFGYWLDFHNALLLVVVNLVALLVNIYSIEYKKGDNTYLRFFGYLGLFIFAMNGLLLSDNLLFVFVFWELVGFASYLLIGYFFTKPAAALAAKKAFIVNRIADLGFVAAIMIIWSEYDTLKIHDLKYVVFHFHHSFFWLFMAGIGLFIASMGKSAQFPFQIWLPDAMEGPTPVSALIHAATMVAAGVYLMVKMSFIIIPEVGYFIAIIGSVTALAGAFSALTQTDIKRVLAFSTISQLGFMMAAIGLGAYEAAFFHLVTHAFFKACLFLSAGSVIHAQHHAIGHSELDAQDMRLMGGLAKKLPLTFISYLISGLALAGLPLLSGFLSKEAILSAALSGNSPLGQIVFVCLVVASFMTAFYIVKQIWTVFFGEWNLKRLLPDAQIHENGGLMVLPLLLLASLSTFIFFVKNPFDFEASWILSFAHDEERLYTENHLLVMSVSLAVFLVGIVIFFLTKNIKNNENAVFYELSFHQLYLDSLANRFFTSPILYFSSKINTIDSKLVDKSVNLLGVGHVVLANIIAWMDKYFVDGLVNFLAFIARKIGVGFSKMQSGNVQNYILYTVIIITMFILALVVWF